MALIDIQRVVVAPRTLTAHVRLASDAPVMTNEDLEGTSRVYYMVPGVVDHVCLGDASETFRDVMGATEVAHLLEHVTVELLAQTNIAGDVSTGRTFAVEGDPRAWDIELACPDDVLVTAALSSAAWMLEWAYTGGEGPEPDVAGIVNGLVGLVQSLPEPEPQQVEEGAILVDELPEEESEAEEPEVADREEAVDEVASDGDAAEPEQMEAGDPAGEFEPEPTPVEDEDVPVDEAAASEDEELAVEPVPASAEVEGDVRDELVEESVEVEEAFETIEGDGYEVDEEGVVALELLDGTDEDDELDSEDEDAADEDAAEEDTPDEYIPELRPVR